MLMLEKDNLHFTAPFVWDPSIIYKFKNFKCLNKVESIFVKCRFK